MKIAMLGQKRIPSREGGVEIVVEELSTRMVKLGHEVTCYNRGGKHALDKNVKTSNEKEYKGVKLSKCFTIDKKGLAAMTSSFFGTLKAIFSKNEVVHYHAEGPCAWMWLIKWFTNKKIVATIHGLDWQRAKWGGFATKYIKFGEKCAAKYADEIIVLSENVKQYFKDTYNRDTNFIPNGVNKPEIIKADKITKEYNIKKDEYILFLGRIVPEKGIHYLIDAYNEAKVDKKLVIAGAASDTDAYYTELKEKAKDNKNIIFTGFVQGQLLEELYSNAYIYCLPSDLEGMPLSLLEAMSYGNCCLTSDIKECSEVLQDKGVTFKKSNIDELSKKLKTLCEEEKKVNKYKDEAQDYILKRYDWNSVTTNTLDLYKQNNKDNDKKDKIVKLCILLCTLICILQNPLQQLFPIFRVYDEILAGIGVLWLVRNAINKRPNMSLSKGNVSIIIYLMTITFIGILSNIIFGYQKTIPIITDIIALGKFYIIYLLFNEEKISISVMKYKKLIVNIIEKIAGYGIFLTIINYIYITFPSEIRYGILSNRLIFSHMTYLAAAATFLLLLYIFLENKPKKKIIGFLILLIVSTLRSKAIAFAALFIIMYIYVVKYKKIINLKMLALAGTVAIIIALPSINYFFVEIDNSARNILLKYSFNVANDHFPLGSGFATYGSHSSGVEYSPIYEIYGIEDTYGLTKNNPSFLSDTFWPMILGQFGYIGAMLYLLIIIKLFKMIQCSFDKNNVNIYLSAICALFYLLISSSAESAFVNPMAAPFAILIGICLSSGKKLEVHND